MKARPRFHLALPLALGLLMCGVGLAAGAPNAVLENSIGLPADILYNGYCDGVHLEAGPNGSVQGNATGCLSYPIIGAPGPRGGIVHVLNDGTYETLYVIRADGTWSNYYLSGGSVIALYNGTWSYGTPAQDAGSLRSTTSR